MKKYYIYQMNMNVLNVISIVLMVLVGVPCFLLTYKTTNTIEYSIIMLLIIPYCILHEIIHSISYVLNGANFKNVTYGMHLEKGVLCCLCKQKVSKKNILISLLAPFFVIGVLTLVIGIIIDNNILIWLSAVNIMGCSGDLLMFIDFLKIKDFNYTEFDDPTSFALYGNEHLKAIKFKGLNYKKEEKTLKITNNKKVTISRLSVLFLIIYVIIILGNLFL